MLPLPQLNNINKLFTHAIDVRLANDGWATIIGRDNPQYNPRYVPHLANYLQDNTPKKIIMGPYGSGKTSGCVNKIINYAMTMPRCDDGIRRCKGAIVRNTSGQLETTTLKTWEFWTEGLPTPKRRSKPQLTYEYRFKDEYGLIEMDVIFLALDRIDDIRKLDSLELTWVYFNELRHIPKLIFDTMQARIGRYPSKANFVDLFKKTHPHVKGDVEQLFRKWMPYEPMLLADTNPPKNKHWIQVLEEEEPDPKLKVYHQPPALLLSEDKKWVINSDADNLLFAGENYYLEMTGRGEEFIKVYAQGKYGTLVDGKPVYAGYNDDIHSVEDLGIDSNEPIYLGWDFGLAAPACILKQIVAGQARAIKEFVAENETVKSLYETAVKPFLNRYCKDMQIFSYHDPANTCEGQKQLSESGLESFPARTNKVDTRIACVSNALDRLHKGKPFYVVSRKGCPTLREALIGEYHYRRLKVVGDEKYVDVPNKVHPYSDIADADQYATMAIYADEGLQIEQEQWRPPTKLDEKQKSSVTGY